MSSRNFRQLLEQQWTNGNFVCVGLDSEYQKIPECIRERHSHVPESICAFNEAIVDATKDFVCAYKINVAFYEAYGREGYLALVLTMNHVRRHAWETPIILDAKRADIGNTNDGYVRAAFKHLEADAVTVNPYLGQEALKPFLDQKEKGIFILCRTSNPGAGEFQDLRVGEKQAPLYQFVAERVTREWNTHGNCGLVVGATAPEELRQVRQIVGDVPILIPGIGAQGGSVEETVHAGKNSRGHGMIINSSRGIIFASSGEDFAEAARLETLKLNDAIQRAL